MIFVFGYESGSLVLKKMKIRSKRMNFIVKSTILYKGECEPGREGQLHVTVTEAATRVETIDYASWRVWRITIQSIASLVYQSLFLVAVENTKREFGKRVL